MAPISATGRLPPAFIALAADDPLFGKGGFGIVDSWKHSGASVELHYYEKGGHGFGSHHQGTTSDLWLEQFVAWMGSHGLLQPSSPR